MKLLYLVNAESQFSLNWANAMAQRGHNVHVATLDHNADASSYQCPVINLPIRSQVGYWANTPWVRTLSRLLRPDVVHAHYASGYGTMGRWSGAHPYVLSVWGSDVYEFPDRSRWHRRLLKANLRAADWVCSTSNAMAGRTLEISPGISNLSITPFGIDTNRFAPTPRAASRRVVTVGTVKKLESIYGIDILLKAFASAKTSIARKSPELDLRLKIVGSGSERTALQGLAAELSIVDSTEFVGRVPNEDVPKHLGQIDVYVALSRCQESFGVAILEASSCAVPVIVSDVGGFPEVVEDGSTGLIVNNEDAADASAAIERLVLDEGMRRRLGDAGRKMVMKRYEWSDSVTIMEDVYGRVLAGHAKARHDK